jgi:hypothetical protein
MIIMIDHEFLNNTCESPLPIDVFMTNIKIITNHDYYD